MFPFDDGIIPFLYDRQCYEEVSPLIVVATTVLLECTERLWPHGVMIAQEPLSMIYMLISACYGIFVSRVTYPYSANGIWRQSQTLNAKWNKCLIYHSRMPNMLWLGEIIYFVDRVSFHPFQYVIGARTGAYLYHLSRLAPECIMSEPNCP